MSAAKKGNLAASIQQRLLDRARQTREDFQVTLNNFLLERFLYRLGRSAARTRFVLKGALLFRVWALLPLLRQFLVAPLAAARGGQSFHMQWEAGGPWREKLPGRATEKRGETRIMKN